MNDQSWTISGKAALELIGLGLAGQMTVETYMELVDNLCRSLLNAKTIEKTTYPAGSMNSAPRLKTTKDFLEQSYTSVTGEQRRHINTQRSHYGCWCNSSGKRGTSDESGIRS